MRHIGPLLFKERNQVSFSVETKEELSKITSDKSCCKIAEMSGFVRASATLSLLGKGKIKINMHTENLTVVRHFKQLFSEHFNIDSSVEIEENEHFRKNNIYVLHIDNSKDCELILRQLGIMLDSDEGDFFTDGIYENIVKTKCCKKAYLRGFFIGSGSINDPRRSYHLEFSCKSETMAKDLRKLINSFEDLKANITKRKEKCIVYMKNSAYISDMLALMGAYSKVLLLEDVKIQKEVRGDVVRITNCDNANTDRTIEAAQRHVEAIKKIQENDGFKNLDAKLLQVALLRLDNPEISITELGALLNPPMKKSGINNRLKKIEAIADKY